MFCPKLAWTEEAPRSTVGERWVAAPGYVTCALPQQQAQLI